MKMKDERARERERGHDSLEKQKHGRRGDRAWETGLGRQQVKENSCEKEGR